MARKPYVVIDSEILNSSVWMEDGDTRLVWLTLLVLCDTEGYVGAAIPGIAKAAGVPLEAAEAALQRFQEPDPYSRTTTFEGRRLEVAERGFRVLNFTEHLDRLSGEKAKTRDRMRRHRARKKEREATAVTESDVTVSPGSRDVGKREKGSKQPTTTAPAKRVKAEKEANGLLAAIAEIRSVDPSEVLAIHARETGHKGAIQTNVSALRDSVFWPLHTWLKNEFERLENPAMFGPL